MQLLEYKKRLRKNLYETIILQQNQNLTNGLDERPQSKHHVLWRKTAALYSSLETKLDVNFIT